MKTLTAYFMLILGLTVFNISHAQVTFQKTFKETDNFEGNAVIQTSDNGYIITGVLGTTGSGSAKLFLLKCDVFGDKLWSKTYGGPDDVRGMDIKQTTDDGYIVVGWTRGFGAGNDDIYLLRTDSVGDTLWTKTYGGTGYEYGFSVQQTIEGGFIIAGQTTSFGAGSNDAYLIKTDSSGDTLWTKTYGGIGQDYGMSVQQTADTGYIVTGYSQSFGAGSEDLYLIKTNSIGDTLWTKTYGGTNTDIGNSVQQTADGGYIILGYTGSWPNYDVYVIKTDAFGDTLWVKTYGSTNKDEGNSIQQTSDGGYIFTGLSKSFGAGNADVYLVKTDSSGAVIWTKAFGSTSLDYGNSVKQTTDGGYIICGFTGGFGASGFDVYLIKTDSIGNSGCNQFSTSTIVNSISTSVSSGAEIGAGTIMNNTATVINTPPAIENLLCDSCYSSSANFFYTDSLLTVNFTDSSTLATSWYWTFGDGNYDTIQNPSHTYASSGTYQVCLTTTNICGSDSICDSITVTVVGVPNIDMDKQINIFPNPFDHSATLTFKNSNNQNHTLILYDTQGRLVRTIENITTDQVIIGKDDLTRGLYFFQLRTDRQVRAAGKLAIE